MESGRIRRKYHAHRNAFRRVANHRISRNPVWRHCRPHRRDGGRSRADRRPGDAQGRRHSLAAGSAQGPKGATDLGTAAKQIRPDGRWLTLAFRVANLAAMHKRDSLPLPPPLSDWTVRQPVALFLDFDGTLVDIAETPDAILVPDDLARRLEGLAARIDRSEEHTSELQSLMRHSHAVFCLQ